LQEKEI